ncbi:alginate lyase family protein [Candidatus Brachybacter algidus]|uniref:alginate lyase family protein n=1 Tax=Candidatus Brachybacter algidus TaxID=2982024 RepID=UPI001D39CBD8|nr:alginate lyase family protein [Candidatus Brachybacter algidus]MBK6450637.1 alginate lyase family protein [Candidatus Brachybacter algidus]
MRKVGFTFSTPEYIHKENVQLTFEPFIQLNKTWLGNNTFNFLNQEFKFESEIDWNYSKNGKLWTYNINYFEFLMQDELSEQEGKLLIDNYINSKDKLIDGLESFPTSLRLINWIKFLLKHQIKEEKIDRFIHKDAYRLFHNPEYHLLGNHLLENGFGLYFAANYLNDKRLYKKAKSILSAELKEQILDDGAHFELSTMYHQHMLFRVLDCYQLASSIEILGSELKALFQRSAEVMLSWLQNMTFTNGETPLFNDSAKGIAPSSNQLFDYAKYLNISFEFILLKDSGYRRYNFGKLEFIVDAGNIGPDYIPGHAHADSFNFVLNYDNKPILVDTGTSTYEIGDKRQKERSTISHNTVVVNDENSSKVWAGFRVGRRAKTILQIDNDSTVKASHDGYKNFGIIHERKFEIKENSLYIEDVLKGDLNNIISSKAYFHFHPGCEISLDYNSISINENIKIDFQGVVNLTLQKYEFAEYWNQSTSSDVLIVEFKQQLKTIISEI